MFLSFKGPRAMGAVFIAAALASLVLLPDWRRWANAAVRPMDNRSPHPELESGDLITVRAYLEQYWGYQWAQFEPLVAESEQFRLEQFIDPKTVPAWDSIASSVRERMRSDLENQRADWIARFEANDKQMDSGNRVLAGRSLTNEQWQSAVAIASGYTDQLHRLAEQSFDMLTEADEVMWDRGQYCASPLVSIQSPQHSRTAQAMLLRSYVESLWTINYVLDSSEWPPLETVLLRIAELRQERAIALAQYAASL